MTEALEQLAFRSRSTNMREALVGLPEILAVARRNNHRVGLTGAVAVADTGYFQVLEGGREAINKTIARIQKDRRHADVRVVSRKPIASRHFLAWSLASPTIQPSLKLQIDLALATCEDNPDYAISLLRTVVMMQALHGGLIGT